MNFKTINTIQDFEDAGLSPDFCDISHRGGTFGFRSEKIASELDIPVELLLNNIGAYCNYLGGGLRASIQISNYSAKITGDKKIHLDDFLQACKRAYLGVEDEQNLNSDYEDGETNWEALGTAASRRAEIKSGY
jgi:hypothetical protein